MCGVVGCGTLWTVAAWTVMGSRERSDPVHGVILGHSLKPEVHFKTD